jgi:hypothetical protein
MGDGESSGDFRLSAEINLSADARHTVVQAKATCPFIGTAIATGILPFRNSPDNPLASLNDVRQLGNSGGGDLGEVLLLFATGNHLLMRGSSGRLDATAPPGLFSLEFPGSQGSHSGHSGILQGDPHALASGRLSMDEFGRLTRRARNGVVTRLEVARFIAENLHRDPNSNVFGTAAVRSLLTDASALVEAIGPALLRLVGASGNDQATHRDLEQKLTKLLGEDNLVGSAGEFGLLFAFFAHKPGAAAADGDPAISVTDLESLFVYKRFPDGWETWKKLRADWVTNTLALVAAAYEEYRRLQATRST